VRRIALSLTDGRGFDVVLVVLPLLVLVAFAGLPLAYNVVIAFQEVDLFGLGTLFHPFVGLDNFERIVADPDFWMIARNTVVFVVGSVACQFAIGFALALYFQNRFLGAGYLRGLFLAAWVMPGLVVGAIWNWVLSGDFGVLNHVLQSLGVISEPIFWRSDVDYSLYAVLIANVWFGTPFNMILLSVGLAAIPDDLYEAAEMDGATALQRFATITLPLMRATIGAVIALGIIFTLQQFDLFAAITVGGPAKSSTVMQYWAWELSFREYDFGRGATISVMMLVVVLLVSLVYVRSSRGELRL